MGNTSISGGSGGGAFDADANTQITPLTPIVLGQDTGNEAALTLDYTTNKATSGDDTGLLINQTDTNSPGASKLLDLQVGGASKFNVDDAGGLSFPGSSTYQQVIKFSNTYPGYLRADGAVSAKSIVNESGGNFLLNSVGIKLGNSAVLSFTQNSGISNAADLELHRDAANTLGQRNGVNPQTFNIYNTDDGAGNYERGHIGWNDTADTFVIGTEAGGTGVARDLHVEPGGALKFKAATGNQLTLGANGSYTWQLTTGHAFGPTGNNVRDLASALIRVKSAYLGTTLDIDQGTLTDDAQALNIASTWNDAADTFTLIKADVTNTASAAGSKLLDLQVGGVSKLSVDAGGEVFGSGVDSRLRLTDSVGAELEYSNWRIGIGGRTAYFYQTTVAKVGMGVDGLRLADSGALRWSSGSQASTGHDLLLGRDSANTLAQRNGVNAQTSNIYNTYTSATEYERAHIGWNDTADTFVIGTEAGSGGGVVRPVEVAAPYLTLKQGADANQYTQSGFKMYGFDDASNYFLQMGVKSNSRGLLYSNAGFINTTNLLPIGGSRSGQLGGDSDIWGEVWGAEVIIDQGTLTDDAQALNITSTWNDAADTFTLIKADVTDTASAAGSKLLDLQVGGTSKFSVRSDGAIRTASYISTPDQSSISGTLIGSTGNGPWVRGSGSNFTLSQRDSQTSSTIYMYSLGGNTVQIAYSRLGIGGAPQGSLAFLSASTANILEQQNGVNAQTYNIYNTDDGAGNAEWLSLGFSSGGDATIQVAKSGTGVARPLFLRGQTLFLGGAAGSNHWRISTTGHFLAQADNTYDIGAASANRPRNGYFSGTLDVAGSANITGTVKTTPTTVGALPAAATAGAGARTFVTDSANSLSSHHGQTVAGGGVHFSPVYSDGTNWLVG